MSAGPTTATSPPVTVLLCAGLETTGAGLDLSDVVARLAGSGALRIHTQIVDDLCHRPDALADIGATGSGRVVLGLCSAQAAESELHHRARRAGLDPFGMDVLNLGALRAALPEAARAAVAAALLAAAAAKVGAFEGAGPRSVRPRLLREGQVISRRALFTLPPLRYDPVAAIAPERCASAAGCDLCVQACPRDALSVENAHVVVDKTACDACGICVSECPRGAVDLPGASLPQIEAQVTELLRAAPRSTPRAVVFACRAGLSAIEASGEAEQLYSAGWLPVSVPCAGMVRPGWLLQGLSNGAAAVGVLACADDCAFGQGPSVSARIDYCRSLLERLGVAPDRVRLIKKVDLTGALDAVPDFEATARSFDVASLREPQATAAAVTQLAAQCVTTMATTVDHPASPLGVIALELAGCTMCEACAHACPTDALSSRSEEGLLTLEFDPAACNGCGLCERSCPEQVLRVRRVTDVERLSHGRSVMHTDAFAGCETCGARFAPGAMVRRVQELLGEETSPATLAALRRCPSCRGLATPVGQSGLPGTA